MTMRCNWATPSVKAAGPCEKAKVSVIEFIIPAGQMLSTMQAAPQQCGDSVLSTPPYKHTLASLEKTGNKGQNLIVLAILGTRSRLHRRLEAQITSDAAIAPVPSAPSMIALQLPGIHEAKRTGLMPS